MIGFDYENDIFKELLFDAEGDELKCSFNDEYSVTIDTEELGYVVLRRETLYKLIRLSEDAESNYELLNKQTNMIEEQKNRELKS